MNTTIKSALNKVKAEDELVLKTEKYLQNALQNKKSVISPVKRISKDFTKKLAMAASLIIIFGVSAAGYSYYQAPVSYLSLDINPSIELGVNRFDKVVSATGYNEDGELVLSDQSVLHKNVKEAVNDLVCSALEKGYIAQDGSSIISLTAETDDETDAQELVAQADEGASEALEENDSQAEIFKDNVALERRDEALEIGLTPGKLNLIQKLMELDPDATVEEYKDASVKDIVKETNALKHNDNGNKKGIENNNGVGQSNSAQEQEQEQIQSENRIQTQDQNQLQGTDTQIQQQNEIQAQSQAQTKSSNQDAEDENEDEDENDNATSDEDNGQKGSDISNSNKDKQKNSGGSTNNAA